MQIDLVAVVSMDGFITAGAAADIYAWTSPEDKAQFLASRQQYDAIVMGSRTYEQARLLIRPSQRPARYVLTQQPEKFQTEAVAGQLEFGNWSAAELVAGLEKYGKKSIMIAGGATIFTQFLASGLVNRALITREPVLLGAGTSLAEAMAETQLTLTAVQQLNQSGTLRFVYVAQ